MIKRYKIEKSVFHYTKKSNINLPFQIVEGFKVLIREPFKWAEYEEFTKEELIEWLHQCDADDNYNEIILGDYVLLAILVEDGVFNRLPKISRKEK